MTIDSKYLTPLAIVGAGGFIALAIFFSGGIKLVPASGTGSVLPSSGQQEPSAVNPKVEGEPHLGNPSAKVKVVYYGDFQCPFCKRYEGLTLPDLKEKYFDTGKAVLYFKNFQFLGQDSITAGIAGECLVKQLGGNFDSYWQWHNAMFERQDDENAGFGSAQDIRDLVRELNLKGINIAKFENCLDNRETEAEVVSDTKEGQNDGVRGTPATFINGKPISGAQPTQVFINAIESELSK